MSKGNKVPVSGRIEPQLLAAVDRFCQTHHQTRSDVLARGLRWIVTPEFQEERERVLAETLDRIFLRLTRHDQRVQRELHILSEMLALFVRAYYNHTPRVPEPAREEFRASGKERFEAFMEALAEHVGRDDVRHPAVGQPSDASQCRVGAATAPDRRTAGLARRRLHRDSLELEETAVMGRRVGGATLITVAPSRCGTTGAMDDSRFNLSLGSRRGQRGRTRGARDRRRSGRGRGVRS